MSKMSPKIIVDRGFPDKEWVQNQILGEGDFCEINYKVTITNNTKTKYNLSKFLPRVKREMDFSMQKIMEKSDF